MVHTVPELGPNFNQIAAVFNKVGFRKMATAFLQIRAGGCRFGTKFRTALTRRSQATMWSAECAFDRPTACATFARAAKSQKPALSERRDRGQLVGSWQAVRAGPIRSVGQLSGISAQSGRS